jgi:hypothetical protein
MRIAINLGYRLPMLQAYPPNLAIGLCLSEDETTITETDTPSSTIKTEKLLQKLRAIPRGEKTLQHRCIIAILQQYLEIGKETQYCATS